MDSLIDNRIFHINVFLILTFFIDNSILGTVSFSDIKFMCGVNTEEAIKNIPQNTPCTAIVWYYSKRPDQKDVDALNKKLKRVLLYDHHIYEDYEKLLKPHKINKLVDDICDMLEKNPVDVLIFDNMYMWRYTEISDGYNIFEYENSGYDKDIQSGIGDLFKKLKIKKPNILFGLMLRYLPDPGFDLIYLRKMVPIFVYPACNFVDCNYHEDQKNMEMEDPVGNVENSVKNIITILNCSKVYLGIQIEVESRKFKHDDIKKDSYTTFCDDPPTKKRRFCVEPLSNFYDKGNLITKYKLAGSLITTYDYDDFGCKCGCGCYAATSAINAGVHCLPKSKFTNCTSWTLMYKDRN